MSTSKEWCGKIYREIVDELTDDKADQKTFAAGFITGQAEKVALGACTAAMIRPDEKNYHATMRLIGYITSRYGLVMFCLGHEIWIARPDGAAKLAELSALLDRDSKNTPAWHRYRAELCGIPAEEVDENFHLRYEQPVEMIELGPEEGKEPGEEESSDKDNDVTES